VIKMEEIICVDCGKEFETDKDTNMCEKCTRKINAKRLILKTLVRIDPKEWHNFLESLKKTIRGKIK